KRACSAAAAIAARPCPTTCRRCAWRPGCYVSTACSDTAFCWRRPLRASWDAYWTRAMTSKRAGGSCSRRSRQWRRSCAHDRVPERRGDRAGRLAQSAGRAGAACAAGAALCGGAQCSLRAARPSRRHAAARRRPYRRRHRGAGGLSMWELYGQTLRSRLLLGSAGYPSPAVLQEAIGAAEVDVVTVALRRQAPEQRGGRPFWELIAETGVRVLPNTAGCLGVAEAVATAQMARELFGTPWIKLEVIGDDYSLQPDVFGLLEAARELVA